MSAVIHELDAVTVDQIAAGEVVERPSGAVKELVENAIDAGATAISVEIEDGGISFLRVTDNGSGIGASEVRKAFLRHATSKIASIEDLYRLHSLGFRGEALSSIAAVSRVEMITRTEEALTGIRYRVEGGRETGLEEIGAPVGTTVVARNLFYNTPARGKFLKKPQTEGMHVADLIEHLAIAHPEISFRFISQHTDRFHTSGTGDLRENIYRIYGRDVAAQIVPIDASGAGVRVRGYLGKPVINRSSRAYELFFVNGRYVRDRLLSAALEEGYRSYLMQHKFPFVVLNLTLPPEEIDVNVHPTKMEVRFRNSFAISEFLTQAVRDVLGGKEMIPDALLDEREERRAGLSFAEDNAVQRYGAPERLEPFEARREARGTGAPSAAKSAWEPLREVLGEATGAQREKRDGGGAGAGDGDAGAQAGTGLLAFGLGDAPVVMSDRTAEAEMDPRTQRILSETAREEYRILGQVFDTYWIIAYRDRMLLLDQHAAHEKVNYERMMKRYHEKAVLSQQVSPPILLNLTPREGEMAERFAEVFRGLGFELESFGDRTLAIRGVPLDLYGAPGGDSFFQEVLDELSEDTSLDRDPKAVTSRIAGMACKASVKGNTRMSLAEVEALLDELLTLENPYHCPHGRPTMVTMSRYEIDKRFKRVVE